MEKFRKNSFKKYGLCLSHYLSAPPLIWDVMLNITKLEFELILDTDMYLCFEKDMRGRASYISNGYSQPNNKYLKPYDPQQESQHIVYLDENN